MTVKINDATIALSKMLRDWIDAKPSRNAKLLARRSQVSYPTVLRAVNSESNTSFENSIKLLEVAASSEATGSWIKKYHPHMIGNYSETLSSNNNGDYSELNKMSELIGERAFAEIICYLYDEQGVAKEYIVRQYGERSKEFIEKLRMLNCITENGDNIRLVDNQYVNLKLFSNLIASGAANILEIADSGDQYASSFYTGKYSKDGIHKARMRFKEYIKDLRQIEREYPGGIAMEFGTFLKPLNKREAEKTGGQND